MDLFLRLFQTSLGFYTDFKPTLVYMDLLCWLFYSFFWSWGDQGQWPETKGIPVWLLNISWVLKWSGTKLYVHSFTLAALLYLTSVLYLSAIKFNNTSSLPMVCINVSLFTIVDYETVVSKRLIIFHSYFANFNITFYRDKWMNKLQSTIFRAWIFANILYLSYLLVGHLLHSISTRYKLAYVFDNFCSPHFQNFVQIQDLSCWLYAQQIKQVQENCQTYTLIDNLCLLFDPYDRIVLNILLQFF